MEAEGAACLLCPPCSSRAQPRPSFLPRASARGLCGEELGPAAGLGPPGGGREPGGKGGGRA